MVDRRRAPNEAMRDAGRQHSAEIAIECEAGFRRQEPQARRFETKHAVERERWISKLDDAINGVNPRSSVASFSSLWHSVPPKHIPQ